MGRLTPKAETSLIEDPKSTIKYFRPPHNWCFSDVHSLTFLYYFLSTLAPIGAIPENCAVPSPYWSKVGVSLTRTGTLYPIIERNKGAIET